MSGMWVLSGMEMAGIDGNLVEETFRACGPFKGRDRTDSRPANP